MENKNYVPPIFLSSFIKIQGTTVSESNVIPSCDYRARQSWAPLSHEGIALLSDTVAQYTIILPQNLIKFIFIYCKETDNIVSCFLPHGTAE